jgi:8-oxo-dGTP diphosphatase
LTPTQEIALALIYRDGKLLVARRNRGRLQGYWEFPGGKIEPGESIDDATVRECREELGVEVVPIAPLEPRVFAYPDVRVMLHPRLCRIAADAEPLPLAAEALAWASPGELLGWTLPDPNYELIDWLIRNPPAAET